MVRITGHADETVTCNPLVRFIRLGVSYSYCDLRIGSPTKHIGCDKASRSNHYVGISVSVHCNLEQEHNTT